MKFWILTATALVVAPAAAEAAHCKALSQAHAEYKKLSQQADRAEKRDDYATACELHRKKAGLADKMQGMKTDCFHGGKNVFNTLALASHARAELACSSDAEDDLF